MSQVAAINGPFNYPGREGGEGGRGEGKSPARGGIRDLQMETLRHRPAGPHWAGSRLAPGGSGRKRLCVSLQGLLSHLPPSQPSICLFRSSQTRCCPGGGGRPSGLLPPGQCLRVRDSARTGDRQEAQLHEDSPPPLTAIFGPSP